MFKLARSLLAPILSLVILVMGNALFVTYASVRLKLDGYSVETIGYIAGGYFAGLMIGCFYCSRLIEKIGHIRAYAVLAALLSVLAMLQAIFLEIWMWAIVRFLGGIFIAGLFIAIESWLLAKSTIDTKGKVLSLYMIAFYASQGAGQLLLNVSDPMSMIPFAIVVILSAVSIVPVSMTKMAAPIIQEKSYLNVIQLLKKCPLGVFACILSGLVLGAIYGLIPIYAKDIGMTIHHIAYAVSITIAGGFVLQWPLGQLSDVIDRRKVLSVTGFGTAALAIILALVPTNNEILVFVLLGLVGGFSFTIYPLGISHASDTVDSKDLIAATAGLALAYSFGAIIGPIFASYSMRFFGPQGLFIYIALIGFILGILSFIRVLQVPPVPKEEKLGYRNMPRTTPLTGELDPRSEEKEEKKEEEGENNE